MYGYHNITPQDKGWRKVKTLVLKLFIQVKKAISGRILFFFPIRIVPEHNGRPVLLSDRNLQGFSLWVILEKFY